MTYTGAGTAATSAAAAVAQAKKASGAIVHVEPEDFKQLVGKIKSPLVVISEGGFLSKKYSYLTSYKGLFFYTQSKQALNLHGDTEYVSAKSIWVP
jgi:hypothetical protein